MIYRFQSRSSFNYFKKRSKYLFLPEPRGERTCKNLFKTWLLINLQFVMALQLTDASISITVQNRPGVQLFFFILKIFLRLQSFQGQPQGRAKSLIYFKIVEFEGPRGQADVLGFPIARMYLKPCSYCQDVLETLFLLLGCT